MGYYGGLLIQIEDARADRQQAIMDGLAKWADKDGWNVGHVIDGHIFLEYDKDQGFDENCWDALWDGEGRDAIARAVWKANGEACRVNVLARDFVECPYKQSAYDADAYEEMMGQAGNEEEDDSERVKV